MRPETERWLEYAQDDLDTARVTLVAERWRATLFHCQQAAEKALKALWEERTGEPPPRTHDLFGLAFELHVPEHWHDELERLTEVYLMSRYPGVAVDEQYAELNRELAEVHLGFASEVFAWVEQQLSTAS